MKQFLFVFVFGTISLITNEIYAQNYKFTITAIDANKKEDSVVIGYKENATVGVDENLGEINLFDNPYADLDIRSIQRSAVTQNTLWLDGCGLNQTEYFQQNIDLKKDYRQYLNCGNHFIVQIVALHYPVTVKVEHYNFDQDVPYTSYLPDGSCGSIYGALGLKDTIAVFNSSSDNLLIGFHPQAIDACTSGIINHPESKYNSYPTFVSNKLILTSNDNTEQTFKIYNSVGKIMYQGITTGNDTTIDVSNYPTGIYFIKLSKDSYVRKFIKK